MNRSISSRVPGPVPIVTSPASTNISGVNSTPLSLRNPEASEKSAARIKGGASLDPRKNDEFSSQGMPAIAINLSTMTFSMQISVLSSRAKSRDLAAQRATSFWTDPVAGYRGAPPAEVGALRRTPPHYQRNPASPALCSFGPFSTSFSCACSSGIFGQLSIQG